MAIKDDYYIAEIDSQTAQNIIVRCHYAHRKAPCTRAFGLYSKQLNRIVGVVMYGSPVNHCLCESLCGFEERYNIYELTRLYVDDGLPKNLESFLVGNTIKLLDKEIIISYSDTEFDHVGIVYQATNFLYTGLSDGHKDYEEIDEHGKRLHSKSVIRKYGGVENVLANLNGDTLYIKYRSQKHRYIYFNCNKRRKKELLAKLCYDVLPYPKQDHAVPTTSTVNIFDTKCGLF